MLSVSNTFIYLERKNSPSRQKQEKETSRGTWESVGKGEGHCQFWQCQFQQISQSSCIAKSLAGSIVSGRLKGIPILHLIFWGSHFQLSLKRHEPTLSHTYQMVGRVGRWLGASLK